MSLIGSVKSFIGMDGDDEYYDDDEYMEDDDEEYEDEPRKRFAPFSSRTSKVVPVRAGSN